MSKVILFLGCALSLIGCTNAILPNENGQLPRGYILHRTSREEIFVAEEIWTKDSLQIPSCVSSIGFSGDVIGATRHPMIRRSPNDPNDPVLIADQSKIEYWLIVANERKSIGPLSWNEYVQQLDDRRVSNLALHKVLRF